MAKVGYIFIATNGEEYAEDKAWMQQYGCVQVIEELSEHERLRPMWKQLISSLERGDELVVSRFSNALRGTRTGYIHRILPCEGGSHHLHPRPHRYV